MANLVDAGLDQVADHRQCADHVAVEGAVAHGHLRLVAGGKHQGGKLVGEGHEQVAANPGLNVFLGGVRLGSRKQRLQGESELLKEAADADDLIANAQIGGQPAAVVDGAGRGVGAGHADAEDVFSAQGIGSNGRHQRGIDAAAEAHQDFLEATLAHIIARSQHQGAVGSLGVILFGNGYGRRIEGIDQNQILCKRCGLGDQLTARIECQRGAVEDQAVVAAHLIGEQQGNAVAEGDGREHLAAHGALAVPEGRRREVDVEARLLAHQLFNRIDGVEAARPEVLVVPCILADGNGQPQAVQLDHFLRLRRGKVALLVKDVVEGQEALVLFEKNAAAIQQNGGVDGWLSAFILGSQGYTRQHGGRQIASGLGQLIDGRAAASQETGLFQEVGGRVTAEGQLGKDGEPRALRGRAAAERDNLLKISGEIPNSGIDLG